MANQIGIQASKAIELCGTEIELFDVGSGAPLLFLHGGQGFDPSGAFVAEFAARRRLIAPSHPGFGASALPDWIDRVDDAVPLYLELLDRLEIQAADVVGCSIGAWIAAELASLVPERVSRLVLAGPVGVKTGPIDKLDIPDIFALAPAEVEALLYFDPERHRPDPDALSDDQLAGFVRSRESLALLTWEPYMHNPKLKHRLHRASMPTLLLRGESDGIVSQDYLERYAGLFPSAETATIPEAGHVLPIEQPGRFAEAVLSFLDG